MPGEDKYVSFVYMGSLHDLGIVGLWEVLLVHLAGTHSLPLDTSRTTFLCTHVKFIKISSSTSKFLVLL